MKIRRLLWLSVVVLVLSAYEVRTHLLIDAADLSSGTVTAVVGFDEEFRELLEQGEGNPMDEIESEAEANGWEAEAFVDGDIEGYELSRDFSSVDELGEILESGMMTEDWGYTDLAFTEEEGELVFEAAGGNPMSDFSGEEGFEGMEDLLTVDFQLAVTFPGPVKEHNGELEDRTVTWDLDDLEGGDLFARSAIGGGFPWAVVGAVLLGLVVVGIVVWRLRGSKPPTTSPVRLPEDQPVGGSPSPSAEPRLRSRLSSGDRATL